MRAAGTGEHSIVLLGLYSKKYPAIGESHGLSVVAGNLMAKIPTNILHTHVLDMVEWGEEDCSRAVELIRATGADALAIGLPYGTFSSLARYYPALRSALRGQRPLVVFGGALATYLSDRILRDIDRDAVVILGEAEEALPRVVHNWLRQQPYDGIPNLHFTRPDGADTRTQRRLVDLRHPKPAFRGQVRRIYARGGQVFVETSRGCSWAACTFCLRGLTDVVGRSFEYRRKPAAHVAAELNSLAELGIEQVTFADEDFLGGSLADCEEFIGEMAAQKTSFPQFDASLTVHSVYSRRDEHDHDARRVRLIERLADLGLRKVFLGVESCSPSQLKRYAKGHTRQEVTAALKRLYGSNIRVEIGVILFDPLCTLNEVKDSLMFMRQHGLVALASGLSSHLRLQAGSHYLTLLHRYEQRTGERLHEPILDPDTLTYPYRFKDERVDKLFQASDAGMTTFIRFTTPPRASPVPAKRAYWAQLRIPCAGHLPSSAMGNAKPCSPQSVLSSKAKARRPRSKRISPRPGLR
jgi:hypothetical protein